MKANRLVNKKTGEAVVIWEDGVPPSIVLNNGDQICGLAPGVDTGDYVVQEIDVPDRPKPSTLEQRIAALETDVGDLKRRVPPLINPGG